MSAPIKTRQQLVAFIRDQVAQEANPRLTISEVAVLVRFHRRTLQRYVDEGLVTAEKSGPTQRVYMRWDEIRKQFPEDCKGI
jgi:predicted transcriptional regulator